MMKRLLLSLSFSAIICSAQMTSNVKGVSIKGALDNPDISNDSGRTIYSALVVSTQENGESTVYRPLFISLPFLNGTTRSAKAGMSHRHDMAASPVTSVVVKAVIFSGGWLEGDDAYDFKKDAEASLRSVSMAGSLAMHHDWQAVKDFSESDADMFGIMAAKKMISYFNIRGEGEAMRLAATFVEVPGLIRQRSTLTASLGNFANSLAYALSSLLSPSLSAQVGWTICCYSAYDVQSFSCDGYTACYTDQGGGGVLPRIGTIAQCRSGNQVHFIAIANYPIVQDISDTPHVRAQSGPSGSDIVSSGSCYDTILPGYIAWRSHTNCAVGGHNICDYDNGSWQCF